MDVARRNALLKLAHGASDEEVLAALERLSRQASAMALTAPERSQQLREQIREIKRDLAEGPRARPHTPPAEPPPEPALPSESPATPSEPASAQSTKWESTPQPSQPEPPSVTGNAKQFAGAETVAAKATAAVSGAAGKFKAFMRSGWTCPACGYGALPTEKFCARCGAEIQRPVVASIPRCGRCGAAFSRSEKFCTSCGNPRGGS